MFGRGIRLFKLFGFTVEIDVSWLIIAVLVTWSLATGYFPRFHENLSTTSYWWMGVFGALGLFASIVFHEFSHSLVARQYGLEMSGIRLFIFGGVAQMDEEPDTPVAEFMMAIAGPIASVLVSGAALGLSTVGTNLGWATPVTAVLAFIAWINGVLVVFNLIPAFPLDGGRILRAILWKLKDNLRWATRIATHAGSAFALFLVFMGVMNLVATENYIAGMWWILLGLFLRAASESSYQQVLVRRVLSGAQVKEMMRTDAQTVPPSISIEDLVENYVYRYHFKMFPVIDEDGRLVGCITTRQVKEVPREQWGERTVGELAEQCTTENSVSPETDAMEAFQKMSGDGQSRLLVVEGDQLRGVIALKDISGLISLKLQLEE
ncbi:MAG: site-2 protease family protein [Planctomycetota bacterium]